MDWDNLRFFGELARSGSMAGAARKLGVEHTTVSRRIQALEKQLGAVLFAREAGQWRLTEAGRQLLVVSSTMQSAVNGLEHGPLAKVATSEGPAGLVRVGATEGFGTQMLASELAKLTLRYPLLSVDLLALPRMLHLSSREADIVISLERPKRGTVIVTKLADYRLYLYGQREYLARKPLVARTEDLRHHSFVHYVDDLLFTRELQLLDTLHRPERFALRSTSITAQYEAVRAGAGLAVLPAFLADKDPVLSRVLPDQACFTRTFWMSMPAESRQVPRIATTWTYLREAVHAMQPLLCPS
ncbi:LysR family transcriptional regulator [Comamonas sp. Y33R10-2]|uniref:LysR family transcriptional regulator n=1 Tax=Comamonas sp. Y33R10-2 TaxID=2853257 RepID=UPI001C5CA918|nr:LysR family transcriptional regulator [Comamonas sp. Y33R10-2]QXZ10913.1 LysR family transcriptional regulator [Comamonas sp. Y33R10-2]